MRIIDVTPHISARTMVWPGDTPFRLAPKWEIGAETAVNVATVTTSTHIGAHIDAPAHVRQGAPDITATPLEACIGDCLVVDVSDLVGRGTAPHLPAPAERVIARVHETRELAGLTELPARLLLRHRVTSITEWDSETPGIDPGVVAWFAENDGLLIGLDLASFDPEVCPDLLAHHACIDAGIVMLEGLDLAQTAPGLAELIALPIPWEGADAAPVRAVLRIPVPDSPSEKVHHDR